MSLSTTGNKFGDFFSRNSKKILLGLIAFVAISLIATGATWWMYKDVNSDALAMVGDEKITLEDLDDAMYGMAFSNDLSAYTQEEKDARLQQLIEFSIARQEAAKLGISVSELEIDEYIKVAIGDDYSSYTEEQKVLTREMSVNSLLLKKVKEAVIGWREADYLVVNFHKYFETNNKEYQVDGMGDKVLIDKTKTDAFALATSLSNRLKNKTITYAQARTELLGNSEFGEKAMEPRTPDMGGHLSKQYFIEGIIDESAQDALYNLSKGEVSDPVADKGKAGETNGEEIEYRYLVYVITDASNSQYSSYTEWFMAMKEKYGVSSTSILSSLTPKAYAASPASCVNTCSLDNAELYVITQYYLRDGGAVPLGANINMQGGTPWAVNDGGDCSSPARTAVLDGTTDSNTGNWSSCGTLNKSFYCASDSVIYLSVLAPTITGTDSSRGYWTWDERTAANNYASWPSSPYTPGSSFYDPDGVADFMAFLNLRIGRNVENEAMNGKRLWEVFRWHPYYLPTPTLGVTLTATPNSGPAPMNSVALTASVSGTATGDVVYNFDCTNDGTADVTQTNNNTTNACDYPSAGVYTARVTATRGGLSATNTATVTVAGVPALSCSVTPQVGLAPLVVRVDAILTNLTGGTYDYDMESTVGYEYTNRPNRVYYTYPNPGTYNVTVRHNPSGLTAPCTPNSITVTDPEEGNGGEVAP